MRILLLGGSKSGKSTSAQRLTKHLAAGNPLYYRATMEPVDEEDRARIARHRADRAGWGFETVERGRALSGVLPALCPRGTVLFDSVTACLACEMFRDGAVDRSAPERTAQELRAVSGYFAHFVCVCDEIWRDGAVYDETTEAYRRGLAEICRTLAAEFDVVAELAAGKLYVWKGELPDGELA